MSEENKTPEQVEEVQAAATETPETATAVQTPEAPVKEEVKASEPEEFDWDAFETGGFGEGYSSRKR